MGDDGESPPVFGLVHQMDENDDAVNQPNQIKGKNKLVHDNLKQFCYKNQLLIKIHFFIVKTSYLAKSYIAQHTT